MAAYIYAPPRAQDVAAFLGVDDPATMSKAEQHVPIVTAFVRAYTRGGGFDGDGTGTGGGYYPNQDVAAVITSATARLVQNPSLARSQTTGPYSVSPGILDGFTLPELAVLHQYRRRAM